MSIIFDSCTSARVSDTLYAVQLVSRLPIFASKLFSNTILSISLIEYLAKVDFQLAIIMSVIFVLGSNVLSGCLLHLVLKLRTLI